jgi:uracil-DNA glycosylase
MHLQPLWDFLEQRVFSYPTHRGGDLARFNLYRDLDPAYDRPKAAGIRRQNLHNYLTSFPARPAALVVGEAPGWRGCRFSGIPFTSEAMLLNGDLPFHGAQSSRCDRPYAEASATIFWRVMRDYHTSFLVWNCLPFHPHLPGKPLSNRSLRRGEIRAHLGLLADLIAVLEPTQVIALGRCAQRALAELGQPALPVRHPSHGGAGEFTQGMEAIFT